MNERRGKSQLTITKQSEIEKESVSPCLLTWGEIKQLLRSDTSVTQFHDRGKHGCCFFYDVEREHFM